MFNRKKIIGFLLVFSIMTALSINSFAYVEALVKNPGPETDKRDIVIIKDCIAKWNKVAPNHIRIRLVDMPTLQPTKDKYCVFTFGDFSKVFDLLNVVGAVKNGDILINNKLLPYTTSVFNAGRNVVIGHELGHLIGLSHMTIDKSIMAPVLDSLNTNYMSSQATLKEKYKAYESKLLKGTIGEKVGELTPLDCLDAPGKLKR